MVLKVSSYFMPRSPPASIILVLRTPRLLLKYITLLLLLLNIRSFPLAWHFRVWRSFFSLRRRYFIQQCRLILKPRLQHEKLMDRWFDSICPLGANPLQHVILYKARASLDECDFNGHLSNSSYAKTLDEARFQLAMELFPNFFRTGGWRAWMPLAETSYSFIREIPILANYEIRLSIGAWDNKWIYLVSRFITKRKSNSKRPQPEKQVSSSEPPIEFTENIHKPINTPIFLTETNDRVNAQAEAGAETLHALAVTQLCFKIGRITIPPALVLAINGFCTPPEDSSSPAYSHIVPPPHWAHVQSMLSLPNGGSPKAMRKLLAGGWKDVPNHDRWWDRALDGVTEKQRRVRIVALDQLRSGLESVKTLE